MPKEVDVAVIGAGMFGAEIAIKAKSYGLSVEVFEAKENILSGASANNQNRLHLGFHYPRDIETGKQSIRGFDAFKQKYAGCIQEGFLNAYFIANNNSLTSASAYLDFCERLGVPYQEITADNFPVTVQGADRGILCDEVVYDFVILRDLVWQHLRHMNVDVAIGERVEKISKIGGRYKIETDRQRSVLADVVINASYADINRLTKQLGHRVAERQFEYTVVPIISLNNIPKVGITIMDGPFMTILPYGKSDNFLLYHVEHTLVAKETSSQLDPRWLIPESAPFAEVDKHQYFQEMIQICKEYVPALECATVAGFLEGPRMVLARKEDSDARHSIVINYDNSYFTVFAGKIDHCMWVADDVGHQLKTIFNI